jgi:hypothetical protein
MQQSVKHIVQNSTLNFADLANSQIAIGCNVYKVAEHSIFNIQQGASYTATIDFTSRGYEVRRSNGSVIDAISALSIVDDYTTSDNQAYFPTTW